MSVKMTDAHDIDLAEAVKLRVVRRRSLWKRIWEKLYIPIMLTPVAIVVFVLFGGALLNTFIEGLGYMPALGRTEVTLDHYIEMVTSDDFRQALFLGLRYSIVPIIISVSISLFIVTQLLRRFKGRGSLKFIFRLPLQIPGLVATFMILTFLANGGFFARIFYQLGVIELPSDFPPILYDSSGWGIMIVYVWNQIAFVTIVLYAFVLGLDPNYEEAARTLGANDWGVFRHVQLPLMMPAILVVSLLSFAFSFGDFATVRILGATHPTTLPVLAYRIFISANLADRPRAMAMMVVVAAINFVILFLYTVVVRRRLYTHSKTRMGL